MAAMQCNHGVRIGCAEDELVLRGGFLPAPIVINVKVVADRKFIALSKSSVVLSQFLTGTAAYKKPLARTLFIERLSDARNAKVNAFIGEIRAAKVIEPDTATHQASDPVASLDLDVDEPTGTSSNNGPRRRRISIGTLMKQLPVFAEVEYPGDASWAPKVLMERQNVAPSIEATATNFEKLLELAKADLADDSVRRLPHGSSPDKVLKAPRGEAGNRSYFRCANKRWITKTLVGRCKYRTLKRRSSDEAPPAPKPAAKRRRKATAAVPSAPGPSDAAGIDPFGA
jgi:hypothetical protein